MSSENSSLPPREQRLLMTLRIEVGPGKESGTSFALAYHLTVILHMSSRSATLSLLSVRTGEKSFGTLSLPLNATETSNEWHRMASMIINNSQEQECISNTGLTLCSLLTSWTKIAQKTWDS